MSHVVDSLDRPSTYKDRALRDPEAAKAARDALRNSSTLYLGNLGFYTTEAQIYELFSQCAMPEEGGGIKRIIMGLHRETSAPCGFAFVEFHLQAEALASMRYISGTKLDERVIRCDLDPGFKEGRQFGRGKSGGQVRDEYREEYDGGRGGWGAHLQEIARRQQQDRRREAENTAVYATKYGDIARDGEDVPTGERPDDEYGRKRRRGDDSDSDSDAEGGRRGGPQRRGEQEED